MVRIADFLTTEVFRTRSNEIPATIPTLGDLYLYSPAPSMGVVLSYNKSLDEGQRWTVTSVDQNLLDVGDVLDELSAAWTGQVDGWANTMFDPLNKAALVTLINQRLDQNYGQTVSLTVSELAFIYGAMLREYCYDIVDASFESLYKINDIVSSKNSILSVNSVEMGAQNYGVVQQNGSNLLGAVFDFYGSMNDVCSGGSFGDGGTISFEVRQNGTVLGKLEYAPGWWYWKVTKIEFFSTMKSTDAAKPRKIKAIMSIKDNGAGGSGTATVTKEFSLDPSLPHTPSITGYGATIVPSHRGFRELYTWPTPENCVTVNGIFWNDDTIGARMREFAGNPATQMTFKTYTTNNGVVNCCKNIKPATLFAASFSSTQVDKITGTGKLSVAVATDGQHDYYIRHFTVANNDAVVTTKIVNSAINYNSLISAWDAPDFNYDYTGVETALNDLTGRFIMGPDENCAPWMDYLADIVLEQVLDQMCSLVENPEPKLSDWPTIAGLDSSKVGDLTYSDMTYGSLVRGELTEEQALNYIKFLQDARYFANKRVLLRALIAASSQSDNVYSTIMSALEQAKMAIESSVSFVRDVLDTKTQRALVYTSAEMAHLNDELTEVVSVAESRGLSLESYVQEVDRRAAKAGVSNDIGLLIESDHQRELFRQQVIQACEITMPTNVMAEIYKDSSVNEIGAWMYDTVGGMIGEGSSRPEFLDIGHGLPALAQPLYVQAMKFPVEIQDSFAATGLITGRSLIINLRDSYLAISDGGAGMAMLSWHAKFRGGNDFDVLVAIDKSMEEFQYFGAQCLKAAMGVEVISTDASISSDWLAERSKDLDTEGAIKWIASAAMVSGTAGLIGGVAGAAVGMAVGGIGAMISLLAGDNIENESRNMGIDLYNSVNGPRGFEVTIGGTTHVDDDAYALVMTAMGWYVMSGAINPVAHRDGVDHKMGVLFPSYAPFRYLIIAQNTSIASSVLTVVSLLSVASTVKYMKLPKVRAGHFMPGLLAGAVAAPLAWVSNKALESRTTTAAGALSSYDDVLGVMDEQGSEIDTVQTDVATIKDLFGSMSEDIKKAGSPEWAKKPYYTR